MRAACVTRVAVASWLLLLGAVSWAGAQEPARSALSIVSAAPNQEVATLAEANEIRIVFSEPMVSLGRIPSTVQHDPHASTPRSTPGCRPTLRASSAARGGGGRDLPHRSDPTP